MKNTLIILLLFVSCFGRAQDTLYKRNGEVIPSKVTEISSTEIKYKRFSMPDGPVFIVAKDEVQKIRFSNGVVDSFSIASPPVLTQTVAPQPKDQVSPYRPPAHTLSGLIENPRSGVYYYNGARINEKKMLLIAFDKNRNWKNKELEQTIMATGDFRRNQYLSGFGGPAILLACLIAAGQSAQNSASTDVSSALAFNGIGIFIASQIISPMFKGKRSRSARKVVQLFNEQVRLQTAQAQ